MISGRILITGGSGFLGRGIIQYAEDNDWDCEFVVYSRDEYKQDLCRQRFRRDRMWYVLGDVKDSGRLLNTMRQGIDCVIHTAAIKYIPEAEQNVSETIDVNVYGSENVVQTSIQAGVQRVVGISTDKACQPVNTYGMTKALMERLFCEYARLQQDTQLTLARYGNVIGSTGSVIPLFKRQLKEKGQLTITDPDMTRYWISIAEAVELIEKAYQARSGEIIIPKPAAMRLSDLAMSLVGGGEGTIEVIGPRPGEKKHEQLLHSQESVRAIEDKLNGCYRLLPPLTYARSEPFELSSDKPEYWWTGEQLRKEIEYATTV